MPPFFLDPSLLGAGPLKGAELEVVIVVVKHAPSALAPVPVSVTRYKPLQ